MRENLPCMQVPRFPSVLLGALSLILILCASLGTGAYLYASATHLISEYRRQLNGAADHAQLFFDQREVLLRAVAAAAVSPDTVQLSSNRQNLETLDTPNNGSADHYVFLLTRRHWNAIHRTGTLRYSELDPARDYRLERDGQGRFWEPQANALATRLNTINKQPHARQVPVLWLHQDNDSFSQLVAYTPIDRENRQGAWLGLELNNIDRALTLTPPPPGTEYILFDIRGQAVLYSSSPPDASELRWVQQDYFGFDGKGWPKHIILSKSIGTGGLRVLYALPTKQLLHDGRNALITALLTLTVFTTVVLVGACLIRRRLLLPARQQQQSLVDSVSLNRKLVAMAPVGLALVDAQGEVVFQENLQARTWMQGDDQWRTRLPGEHEPSTCTDVTLKDGRSVRVHAISLHYRGQPAALCSIIDVTAEKAEEAALRHSRQLAENANIAKTQFLTTMSHEIRTPLYGILGTLELLSLSEKQQHPSPYLDTLRRSAETLFRVVGESLDLSRIEAGHVTLEPREFCAQEQVDETIAAFAATAQNKGLLLYSITPVRALVPTIGDPLKIRQILSNLISNAIKFTTSGHVVLRLHTEPQPGNRLLLRFQITDSGQGISAEVLPKLFLPYFSLNEGSANKQPGTGLGLPICQRLASLMGGSLSVVSEPGLGTSITFEVILPVASPPGTAPAPESQLAFRPVYVTGDIPEIVSNVSKWLRHWGAYALPYTGQVAKPGAVLVHSWPSFATSTPEWTGRQVMVQPNTQTQPPQADNPDCFYTASTAMKHIMQAVQQAQALDCAPQPTKETLKPSVRPQRVLVVDDNPVNRQILQEQLTLLGCTTHLEASGEAALTLANKDQFDIVFTDLFMPGMDGYSLARALRAEGYQGRIIGITANAILDKDKEWSAAGMDALLIKPLPMAALRDSLQPPTL
ncbi:ATP-binding protein [Alcaligenes sp. DN25]|uniref:ATP-binding protein n=1 Tax=Alcaligenes TaxID=507 RepID=UPI002030893D|nr:MULTISPECIES: ATP-binding protein [Alcaligenes]URW81833.1 ATP-binding protein [Alcaligenes sp. DN25]UTM00408.1 ATP-binding protein [Alcaligenes sp. NLF5-7]WEA66650.1 ATP-binding protein [Alcaligenes faecalis]